MRGDFEGDGISRSGEISRKYGTLAALNLCCSMIIIYKLVTSILHLFKPSATELQHYRLESATNIVLVETIISFRAQLHLLSPTRWMRLWSSHVQLLKQLKIYCSTTASLYGVLSTWVIYFFNMSIMTRLKCSTSYTIHKLASSCNCSSTPV